VRERTRDGLPAPRAHTGSAARGQDREDRRRDVCVPRQRPCPGADRAHASARSGRNAHTHVAGRLRPCAPVWHHGTDAPGGGRTHDAPRKSSAPAGSWCPRGRHAPGGAGVARGRPGARLLRPRSRSWRRWSAIWQKSFLKDPGPPGRPPQNLYGRPPGEAPNRPQFPNVFPGMAKNV
jgi:hypothetical protein